MEMPNNYDGGKYRNIDTWLLQVSKCLNQTNIPVHVHLVYVALLLHGNAVMCWCDLCESKNYMDNWD